MKIHYVSDLHVDFWVKEKSPCQKMDMQIDHYIKHVLGINPADVLIIAGDLGHYFVQDTRLLTKLKDFYNNIILVRGNHDMYLVSNSIQKRYNFDSMNRVQEMKDWCKENDIHYLDGDVIEIDSIKFGGIGMSWDKSFLEKLEGKYISNGNVISLFNRTMNDSRLIMKGKPIRIGGIYSSEFISTFDPLKYQLGELEKLSDISDVDIMISHYGPTTDPNMRAEYKNSRVTTFFYFDGEDDIRRIKPRYWIYGHTHDSACFNFAGTKMLCNPIGYPGEGTYNIVQMLEI